MDISIIVVNYNTFQLTSNCITSIYNSSTSYRYEIILIDNNSSECDPEKFKLSFPDITVIANTENIGFGAANNQGMKISKGKYILLLNSDTVISEDTLDKCYNFINSEEAKNKNILTIGCRLLNSDGTIQPSVFPYLNNSLWTFLRTSNPILTQLFRISKLDRHQNFDFTKTQQVGDISGAFIFLDSETAKKTNYFDTDFFMYCEDTEWCRERLSKVGKIFYFSETSIIHYGGQSTPKDFMVYQSTLSRHLLWYKKGWLNFIGYLIISTLNILCHIIIYPLVKNRNKLLSKFQIRAFWVSLPYIISDIPRYPQRMNARTKRLIFTN